MNTETNKNLQDLRETFWNNHKNIKRKTTYKGLLEAQKEQLHFCHSILSKLTDSQLKELFGKYVEFVKKWINSKLVINKFGKHLYVELAK